jgi:hypothetical protein
MVPVIHSFVVGMMIIALAMTSGGTSGKFAGGWRRLLDASHKFPLS